MDLNTPNSIINESIISNQKDADESQQPITEIIAQSTEPAEQRPQPMEQQKEEQTAQHQQQAQILKPQQQTTPPPTQQMTQQQQCQQPSTDEDEEQSIVVIDPVDNEPIEIPMGKDGCVWLSTLEHAFPGAYGLKYKNPATGAKRMLSFDDSTKQFVTPPGGWSNKVFELIFRTATTTPAPAPAETGSKDVVTVTKPEQSMLGTKRRHELSPAAADGYSDDGEKRLKKPEEEFNQSRADGGDPDNEIKEDLLVEKRNEAEKSKGGNAAEKQQQQSAVVGSGSGDQVGSKNDGGTGVVIGKSPVAISKRAQAGPALARLNKLNRLSSDMIVMGLPFDLEDWALLEYFEQFGPVKFKEIKRKNNGGSRGFGFVQMEYYADQVNALSQFKHVIGDRECQVRISSTEKGLDMYLSKTLTNKPRLFVGGISDGLAKDGKDLLREYLNEHLWRFDKSASVLDMYTPRPFRNFMFVTVSSLAAGRELVRQRDFILDGHHLEVMVAVQRGGGGGGGPAMDDMPPMMKRQQFHHQHQQQPQPWAVQPPRQPPHPAGPPIAGGYGGGGAYGGPPQQHQQHPPPYQPPPEMDSRWDWPPPQPQQGNGRAPPVVHQHFGGDHFVEEYAAPPMPRGGGGGGGGGGGAGGPYYGGHGYAPMVYPSDMPSSVPLYDPREDIRMEQQQQQNYHPQQQQQLQPAPGSRGGAEWGPGGAGSHGQQQPTASSSGAGQHKNISAATAEAVLAQLPQDAVGTALKMLQSIMQQRQGQGAAENGGGGAHGDGSGI